jgi:hypothetical protein
MSANWSPGAGSQLARPSVSASCSCAVGRSEQQSARAATRLAARRSGRALPRVLFVLQFRHPNDSPQLKCELPVGSSES